MKNLFIPKIVANRFRIGSFDLYKELSKELIMKNSLLDSSEALSIIDSMPEEYRASIVYIDGSYTGFIGLYNINEMAHTASIRLELNSNFIDEKDKNLIIQKYKKWVDNSLGLYITEEITFINPVHKLVESISFSIPSFSFSVNHFLLPGISRCVFEKFLEQYYYDIPDLEFSFSIKYKNTIPAIIGLSDIVWSNSCANLYLFLDKDLGDAFPVHLGEILNNYLEYVHHLNIHNISCSVSSHDKNILQVITSSNMRYYGQIPFSSLDGENAVSSLLFQHVPGMFSDDSFTLPDCPSYKTSIFRTNKQCLDDVLSVGRDYKLISPMVFDQVGVDISSVLFEHTLAMMDREHFTKPLGMDKYILQSFEGDFSLLNFLMHSTYILLDHHEKYHGFVNILHTHANHLHAEIEVGLDFLCQYNGLDTLVLNKIYEELFSTSYASVTTSAYSFHTSALLLNHCLSNLVGVQLESYYMDGQLWNKHYYNKVHERISSDFDEVGTCIKKSL